MNRPWIPGLGKINYLAKKDTTHIQSKLARSSSVTIPRKQLKGLEKVCQILSWNKYQCIIESRWCSVTSADHKGPNWPSILGGSYVERKFECDTRSFSSHNWRKRKDNSKSWIQIGWISSCKSSSLIGCLLGTNLKTYFQRTDNLGRLNDEQKVEIEFCKTSQAALNQKVKNVLNQGMTHTVVRV